MSAPAATTPMKSVLSGGQCVGFILHRAKGIEAYSADLESIGLFANEDDGTAAILTRETAR